MSEADAEPQDEDRHRELVRKVIDEQREVLDDLE